MKTLILDFSATIPKKWVVVISGTLLFNFLFWGESLGINLLLFTAFVVVSVHFTRAEAKVYPLQWLVFSGLFVGAFSLMAINTFPGILLLYLSLFLYCVLTGNNRYRTLLFPMFDGVLSVLASPAIIRNEIYKGATYGKYFRYVGRWAQLLFLPLIIAFIFLLIYLLGSPVFQSNFSFIMESIFNFISIVLSDYPFSRIIMIAFVLLILSGLFFQTGNALFFQHEQEFNEELQRTKSKEKRWFKFNIMALKYQHIRGVVVFMLLSAILGYVVVLDLVSFLSPIEQFLFYKAVHTGVYVLMFSIFISILLVLYYFYGKLNFFSGNKWLRYSALSWLAMNAFLVLTTAWKNILYIEAYGLTHKRIGVFLFLLILLIMLSLVHVKVMQRKSMFYLFKTGSIAVYLMLICYSLVSWDVLIARYNLSRQAVLSPDYHYLLSLSDNVIPVLVKYHQPFGPKAYNNAYLEYTHAFESKMINYRLNQKYYSRLSWTNADQRIKNAIVEYETKFSKL